MHVTAAPHKQCAACTHQCIWHVCWQCVYCCCCTQDTTVLTSSLRNLSCPVLRAHFWNDCKLEAHVKPELQEYKFEWWAESWAFNSWNAPYPTRAWGKEGSTCCTFVIHLTRECNNRVPIPYCLTRAQQPCSVLIVLTWKEHGHSSTYRSGEIESHRDEHSIGLVFLYLDRTLVLLEFFCGR